MDATKGKNFSKANRGQRKANDFYQTPYSMTEGLLDKIGHPYATRLSRVLEPAAGDGAILRVLHGRGVDASGYDLMRDGLDFLEETGKADWIITNPPFSISLQFIQKCKQVARKGFWLLMPIEYLHGQERYEKVYNARDGYPLKKVYVFTRRAMLSDTVREDGLYATGMVTWAWYGWLRMPFSHRYQKPEIDWIDNNRYVARVSKKINLI